MTGTVAPTGPYWLGTGPAEVEHLVAQAETYAAEAGELLDCVGPLDGATAIDVGCGALGILAQLRAHVGPAGRVVGLDLEPRLLAVADRLAADRGLAIETVHGAAAATRLPAGSFDLVHARTLLINVTAPQAVVGELVRVARPGGTVALQEPDPAAWVCDPPHPAFDRIRDAVIAAFVRAGKDFRRSGWTPTAPRSAPTSTGRTPSRACRCCGRPGERSRDARPPSEGLAARRRLNG